MKTRRFISEKGFTLVELMGVIVIIILLVGLIVMGAQYANRKAGIDKATAEIKTLEVAIQAYKDDNGTYPPAPLSLGDLIPRYMSSWPRNSLTDPFGTAYSYSAPGSHNITSFDLSSYGPDLTNDNGTNDDITNWTK